MRTIGLRAEADQEPAVVFVAIADFERYPALAADVRAVRTTPAAHPGTPQLSDWEVNFRRGIMRWTERELLDADRLRIEFEQTDGDFEDFRGSWQLSAAQAGGTEIAFEVSYDFGIESLAGLMDPIAERVIKRVVCEVLACTLGNVRVVEGAEALRDLGEPLPALQLTTKGAF
jgi:ribosome-associated toxin RatA of RatAB toxin-antitoxin module